MQLIDNSGDLIVRLAHPIPACRIVAVTLPPALDIAFMVSLVAATGDEVIE